MALRIFIIILLLWVNAPGIADAARLTLGVVPGTAREAGAEAQARNLAARLTIALGEEVAVRLFDNPAQLGQWLGQFAMIELGLVDRAFLAAHPGKFLTLGAAEPSGDWLVVTRQGTVGDFPQRVIAALHQKAPSPPSGAQSAKSIKPPVASPPRPAPPAVTTVPPSAPAATVEPLTLGLLMTRSGLLRTQDQARQFAAQLGRGLGVPIRVRLFEKEQTFVDWFSRFQMIDLALVDEPGRHDPLAGNYRPLQRLTTAGGKSGLLVSRRDFPAARVDDVLRMFAVFGDDPGLEKFLTATLARPAANPAVNTPVRTAPPTASSAMPPVTAAAASAPLTLPPPVFPRLPAAPAMPAAPEKPLAEPLAPRVPAPPVVAAATRPAAPAAPAEPPVVPGTAAEAPASVAPPGSPAPRPVAEPPAPVAETAPPAPARAAEAPPRVAETASTSTGEPSPVATAPAAPPVSAAVGEPSAPAVKAEPPPVIPVVAIPTETIAAVPETVAATPSPAEPAVTAVAEVPAVIAQPDLPQELRPPGVPQPRPGRLPEAAPPAEEPTLFGKLQDLFGRTPKPPPLLPPPDPEPGVVYVVPFITLMVPAEVRERTFDQFVDLLNQNGAEQGLRFVILKQGLDKLDRAWLDERKYVLGEIYGYVEDSGCCSTDLRTRARLTFYRAHLPDPSLKYEYPVRTFFDHDQSTLTIERQKLSDLIAEVLAGELLKVLKP